MPCGLASLGMLAGGKSLEDFAALAIARYAGESGYYLFYCDENWRMLTDTYHRDVQSDICAGAL